MEHHVTDSFMEQFDLRMPELLEKGIDLTKDDIALYKDLECIEWCLDEDDIMVSNEEAMELYHYHAQIVFELHRRREVNGNVINFKSRLLMVI